MEKAVALRYAEGLPAPFILSKGKRQCAERLVQIAKEHGIEIIEMPELTEALFDLDVGSYVPEDWYELIAELLVFVYSMQVGQ